MPQFSVFQKVSFTHWRAKWIGFFLLVSFFFSLTLFLGFWQLERAQQKEASQAFASENSALPSSQWRQATHDQLINLSGKYDARFQFLLDNKPFEGQAGYDLLVPFIGRVEGDDVLFWVNLGWIKASVDRQVLARTSLPNESINILARVYLPSKKVFRLSDNQFDNPSWPKRVQYFDSAFFAATAGFDSMELISAYELRLEDHQPGLQVRRWLPELVMSPDKHVAYAVQWFLLAFALIVLVVVFLVRHFKESVNNEI